MLGLALAKEALKQNIGVAAIIRKDSKYTGTLPNGVEVIKAGMDEYKDIAPDTPPCDCFFHLAWGKTALHGRDESRAQAENIINTIDAVNMANRMGCSAFVGAGSQAEYGTANTPISPYTAVNPESGYGIAKFAAGKLSCLAAKQLGMKHNWLRIASVYGPGSRVPAIIPSLIKDFSHGVCPKLTPCEQMWDFLYSADAARAMLAVADKGADGKVYVLGSGEGKPLKEYVTQIRDIVNPSVKLQFGTMDYYPHQAMYLVADITELTRDTGWKPAASFAEGIKLVADRTRQLDRIGGGVN